MIDCKALFLKDIDLKNGTVTYNDFDINPGISFEEQTWSFKQDVFQMKFNNKYLIDIGWYPDFDPKGSFVLKVVKDFDWSNPILEKKCKEVNVLKIYLQEAINFVSSSQF